MHLAAVIEADLEVSPFVEVRFVSFDDGAGVAFEVLDHLDASLDVRVVFPLDVVV